VSLEPSAAGRFRPPDDFLPTRAQNAQRSHAGEPEIFLSWGGAIYGPARAEEVTAGVRTSWFDKDTLFWVEGQTEWRPVDEFPGMQEGGHHTLAGRRIGTAPDEAPPLPTRGSRSVARPSGARTRYAGRRSGKSGSSRRKGGRGRPSKLARLLIFGVVILAVALTVALLFLLMQM
jgi:hypothetical protein